LNTSEAKILALVQRAKALSAEIDMMKIHDQYAMMIGEGINTKESYQYCVDGLYRVEQDIYAVIGEGWL
jgi:hypothetical protein